MKLTKKQKEQLAESLLDDFKKSLYDNKMCLDQYQGEIFIVDINSNGGAEDEDSIYGYVGC